MSMPESQKHLLTRNRVRLIRDLIPNEEFFAVLMSDHTLTPAMVEDIQSAKTTQSKVGRLLDILPKRGAKAFQTFLNALRETHHEHLLDILDPSGAAASSQRSGGGGGGGGGGGVSQPIDDRKFDRLLPSETSSSKNTENPKYPQQASVQPPGNSDRKPVQPVDSVQVSGKVLDEIGHLVDKIIESKKNFIEFNSPDLQCVDGGEADREQKLLMSSGHGAIIRMTSSSSMSFDDINLALAFKEFGFDVKTQSCENMVASLVKENEETSAVFVFIFASHSPDGAVAEQISRITEIFKTSAVLKGKPKVLIHQTIAAGVPSGDQSDSIRDDVTRRLSSLSLDGSDDNVAVLSVLVSKEQQIRWLVCSLVVLLMKYSKTMDLATMLKHVRDVHESRKISVHLESSLKDGLYFSPKS